MMDIVTIYDGDDRCQKCLGWKRVADSDDQESWKYWAELPAQAAIAVQLGIVKPIECPRCNGTGAEPNVDVMALAGAMMTQMAELMQRKTDKCFRCQQTIVSLEKVGRSVYARPCGCRLYQGVVPDAWRS